MIFVIETGFFFVDVEFRFSWLFLQWRWMDRTEEIKRRPDKK